MIDYEAIAWAPNSNQLALLFSVRAVLSRDDQGAYSYKNICGILLSNPLSNAHAVHILSHVLATGEPCSFSWNVVQGKYLALPMRMQAAQTGWFQSPTIRQAATEYQWQQGTLQALDVLSSAEANQPAATNNGHPSGAVGNPIGQSMFSIWQPGQISVQTMYRGTDGKVHSDIPGVQTFSTSFTAWSPDSAFVSLVVLNGWRFEPPTQQTPSSQTLQDFGLTDAPVLPIRDKAIEHVLSQAVATHPNAAGIVSTVAWRPDGRYLATPNHTQADSDPSHPDPHHHLVTIYDAVSGKVIANLRIPVTPGGVDTGTYLQWSPDGSHLAYFDTSLGALVLWGPNQLPR